jgi:MarR family transcriptional regulator, transcriptional regulator for hemolysin
MIFIEEKNKPLGMVISKTLDCLIKYVKVRLASEVDIRLTFDQSVLLFVIYNHGADVIQKDMAQFMGKDKSAILRMINSLEEKSMLKRVVDLADRRKNQIVVTEKGEQTIKEFLRIELEINGEILDGLSETEINVFYKVLNHIRNRAELLR